ncbi:MAG TPA: signal recognition particle protein [Candidatus Aphodousia faecigallinarum]|uniref:Signal recognition particle protein n=1 Tax=Candidatus Aphodousia faecigallinarum TaxID=2840677 RepID=A0A9D1IIY6_9BURK|nr:signal recognition particle protein [Candidatus Aphodousia faecigallinarum]
MLNTLSQRLSRVIKTMRGQARLTEENTKEMLREVRIALLEADVALPVVRELIARIKAKAMNEEVIGNLNPGQALVGIVQKELTDIIGGSLSEKDKELNLATQPPAIILLAGLQGAGKTTSAGKLARFLVAEKKKKVLTVSTDVYRPAAADQLKVITEQAGADNFPMDPALKPLAIAKDALTHAKRYFYDVLIVDTAGRLSIDEAMMNEVAELHDELKPSETMFVADAMLGQTAVQAAQAFNERLALTGVILTKLDGDSRGGAALSVAYTTGKPIKFVGVSEKIDGLEPFNAEGMASRILGMGDIVALVKDVQKAIDVEQTQKLAQKMRAGNKFDLNDFKAQLAQMKNMGSFSGLMEKLPTQFAEAASKINDDDAQKAIARTEGIINSMTPFERTHPDIIKASRKRRIAAGAGVPVQEVNKMLKQFEQTQTIMRTMQKGGLSKMMRALGGLSKFGGGLGGMGGFGNFGRH